MCKFWLALTVTFVQKVLLEIVSINYMTFLELLIELVLLQLMLDMRLYMMKLLKQKIANFLL